MSSFPAFVGCLIPGSLVPLLESIVEPVKLCNGEEDLEIVVVFILVLVCPA